LPNAHLQTDTISQSRGCVVKVLSEDKSAVLVAADLTPVINAMLIQLKAFPASIHHLGQACLGAVLIQALTDTDEDEKIEIQWQSTGPFGNLYADVLGTGKIRGTIQNLRAEVDSLKASMGPGLLQVRRSNQQAVLSTGIVASKGVVAEDLRIFLEQSEQKTCAINLQVAFSIAKDPHDGTEVLVVSDAFGFMLHLLPTESPELRDRLMKVWDHRISMLGPLNEWSLPQDSEKSVRAIIEWLTVGSKPTQLKKYPVEFYCSCSVDRIQRAIALLTPREKKWILTREDEAGESEVEKVSVNCEFCGKTYAIEKNDLLEKS